MDKQHKVLPNIAEMGDLSAMDCEAKADAIEEQMIRELNISISGDHSGERPPTVAEIEEEIPRRTYRRGVGFLFVPSANKWFQFANDNVRVLSRLPERPTLADFFKQRFTCTRNHVLQSAGLAMRNGMSEEIILACLLHDVAQEIMKTDHGWWGGQLFEPYVSERVSFAIRYHQALRYYPDESVGYEYPDVYRRIFGSDYVPPPYIEQTYQMVRKHRWYMDARMVTVNDYYAFDPDAVVTIEPFLDIIGRHFKQPKEGLGQDNSPVSHMWRTIATPDLPL